MLGAVVVTGVIGDGVLHVVAITVKVVVASVRNETHDLTVSSRETQRELPENMPPNQLQ